MNFHDGAFEKAYLQIIKESTGSEEPVDTEIPTQAVCPECGNEPCTCEDEQDNTQLTVCGTCGQALADGVCQNSECPEFVEIDECGDQIGEANDDQETDEDPEAEAGATEADDNAEEDGKDGKFISFFTTNPDLIDALQNGFAKITVVSTDEKAEPVEFEADVFENLSVEDLKEDEAEEPDQEAEADMDVDAAAEDEGEEPEQDAKPAKPAKK